MIKVSTQNQIQILELSRLKVNAIDESLIQALNDELNKMFDLSRTEMLLLASLALPILYFGFNPDPILKTIDISVQNLISNYELAINNQVVKK